MSRGNRGAGAGPKGSGAKKGEDIKCPDWVFGIKTVLDGAWSSESNPMVDPPIAQYLEEVLLGIVGGAGDPAAKDIQVSTRQAGATVSNFHRAEALQAVLTFDPSKQVCKSLFWLVVGGTFGQLQDDFIYRFRGKLGESWFALTLQSMVKYGSDREMQDALLWTLPFLYAQVIYRLLVDGFIEDRKEFVNDAEPLILKASQIAHFELTGFQLTADVVRKSRSTIFLRRVVQSPHMNQREIMKGRKRQELLESHAANNAAQPLGFGDEAGTLEDSQLDHVLHLSKTRREAQNKDLAAGKMAWQLDTTPCPSHLSVTRHLRLNQVGKALRRAHAERVCEIMGEEGDLDDEEESDGDASEGQKSPTSPLSATTPAAIIPANAAKSQSTVWMSEFGDADNTEGERVSPLASSTPAQLWRKGINAAKFASLGSAAAGEHRSRREREAKALKLRQEALERKICKEPLPNRLSERSFTTTWVSPAIASLAGEGNREVLQKTSAEAFTVKMQMRPPNLSQSLKQHSVSMPALRPSSRAANLAPGDSSPNRPGTGVAASQVQASRPSSCASPASRTGGLGSSGGPAEWRRSSASQAQSSSLPRVVLGSRRITVAMPVEKVDKPTVVNLEPPARLEPGVVDARLEAAERGFEKLSFAIYRQEHDVLTGIKKWSMDSQKLHDQEEEYVKHMRALVGGRAKKLIVPESIQRRQRRRGSGDGGGSAPPADAAALPMAAGVAV